MNDTAELTHLDESILEDECKCEVNHTETVCSYEVTHVISSCKFEELCCWNATRGVMGRRLWKMRHSILCLRCGQMFDKCWTIRPV